MNLKELKAICDDQGVQAATSFLVFAFCEAVGDKSSGLANILTATFSAGAGTFSYLLVRAIGNIDDPEEPIDGPKGP